MKYTNEVNSFPKIKIGNVQIYNIKLKEMIVKLLIVIAV